MPNEANKITKLCQREGSYSPEKLSDTIASESLVTEAVHMCSLLYELKLGIISHNWVSSNQAMNTVDKSSLKKKERKKSNTQHGTYNKS